jgi:hypothetical protein
VRRAAGEAPGVDASQPRYHRDRDAIAFGDRHERFTGSAALDGLGALIVGQFALAPELHPLGYGALTAFAGPLADQLTFNSAMPASKVESNRPCALDVSQRGSPSDRKAAPALLIWSIRSSSSRVERILLFMRAR